MRYRSSISTSLDSAILPGGQLHKLLQVGPLTPTPHPPPHTHAHAHPHPTPLPLQPGRHKTISKHEYDVMATSVLIITSKQSRCKKVGSEKQKKVTAYVYIYIFMFIHHILHSVPFWRVAALCGGATQRKIKSMHASNRSFRCFYWRQP